MKKFGIVGHKGKLGSLLLGRPNFVSIDVDVTDLNSITSWFVANIGSTGQEFDVVVNCSAISSIDECEKNPDEALLVNTRGVKNLHKVFGERVLTISSDHVFNGKSWILPKESTAPSPSNAYGFSKWGAEIASQTLDGKVIRLSRSVGINDVDISTMMACAFNDSEYPAPIFFSRNYLHRDFVVDGIVHMVENWDTMPQLVNYAGTENVTMYSFMRLFTIELGLDPQLITKRTKYDDSLAPRPRKGGLNVSLAKSLGFPMYNISDTVSKLVDESKT